MEKDEKYMCAALKEAGKAYKLGEVPIGCVIVHNDQIIGRGYNRRNTDKSTLSHAEIRAIASASRKLSDWRLEECTLYVTLEPCQMCAGAIVQARIPHIVMGCKNPKAGCAGSVLNILQCDSFNHQVEVTEGVLEKECADMLQTFFRELRVKTKLEEEQRQKYVPTGRPLCELSREELWQLFPIVLKEYNPMYPKWYEEESKEILRLMKLIHIDVTRINHYGSTSVPGLLSKPTIDILLELKKDSNWEYNEIFYQLQQVLSDNGWILMSHEDGEAVFNKGYTPYGFAEKVYHLHVRTENDWDELHFSEYLRQNPAVAAKYGKLKLSLWKKYEYNRDGYTEAKSDFVLSHTKKARQQKGSKKAKQRTEK